MTGRHAFIWYLHGPNLLILALVYMLFGRLLFSFVGAGSLPARLVAAITAPVTVSVGAITPRIVPHSIVIVFAIVWLLAFRAALSVVALVKGVQL